MRRNIIIISVIVAVAIAVIDVAIFFGAQSSVVKSSFYGNQLSAKASPSFKLIQTIPIPMLVGALIIWM